jgi:hypothetical protein
LKNNVNVPLKINKQKNALKIFRYLTGGREERDGLILFPVWGVIIGERSDI